MKKAKKKAKKKIVEIKQIILKRCLTCNKKHKYIILVNNNNMCSICYTKTYGDDINILNCCN